MLSSVSLVGGLRERVGETDRGAIISGGVGNDEGVREDAKSQSTTTHWIVLVIAATHCMLTCQMFTPCQYVHSHSEVLRVLWRITNWSAGSKDRCSS